MADAFFAACARVYMAEHLKRCYAARHNDRNMQAMLAWIPDWWQPHWRAQQAWIEEIARRQLRDTSIDRRLARLRVRLKPQPPGLRIKLKPQPPVKRRNSSQYETRRAYVREYYRLRRIQFHEQREPKRCAFCKREFKPDNYLRELCSDACRKAWKRQHEAAPQRRQHHRERGREYREKRKTVVRALREMGIVNGYDIVEQP